MNDDGSHEDLRRHDTGESASEGQADIPALALGTLDSDEAGEVRRELETSEFTRRELGAYEDVVGDLGFAVPLVAPPPDLRDRVLTATMPRDEVSVSLDALLDVEQPLIWSELAAVSVEEESPGFLARSADGQATFLVLTGLETKPEHVFQAWLIDETPLPAGTLNPIAAGTDYLVLQLPDEPEHGFGQIGITIEPPGGSLQPTTVPIVVTKVD